jgi:hypothetical protein
MEIYIIKLFFSINIMQSFIKVLLVLLTLYFFYITFIQKKNLQCEAMIDLTNSKNQYLSFTSLNPQTGPYNKSEKTKISEYVIISFKDLDIKKGYALQLFQNIRDAKLDFLLPYDITGSSITYNKIFSQIQAKMTQELVPNVATTNVQPVEYDVFNDEPLFIIKDVDAIKLTHNNMISGNVVTTANKKNYIIPWKSHISPDYAKSDTPGLHGVQLDGALAFDSVYNILSITKLSSNMNPAYIDTDLQTVYIVPIPLTASNGELDGSRIYYMTNKSTTPDAKPIYMDINYPTKSK